MYLLLVAMHLLLVAIHVEEELEDPGHVVLGAIARFRTRNSSPDRRLMVPIATVHQRRREKRDAASRSSTPTN